MWFEIYLVFRFRPLRKKDPLIVVYDKFQLLFVLFPIRSSRREVSRWMSFLKAALFSLPCQVCNKLQTSVHGKTAQAATLLLVVSLITIEFSRCHLNPPWKEARNQN